MDSEILAKESSLEKKSFPSGINPEIKSRGNKSKPKIIKQMLKGKPFSMQKIMLKPENDPLRVRETSSERELEKEAEEKSKGGQSQTLFKTRTKKVLFTGYRLDKPLPEGAETPEHSGGRGATTQRQYSVRQYIDMWEKERGRKMTDAEKETLARGCIGITAIELNVANPPLDNAYGTFEQAYAVMKKWNEFVEANKDKDVGNGLKIGDYKAVLFAKLFWSNQSYDPEKRKKPDEKAFRPDPRTGKVDMSGYRYIGRPGYINFDYGFWDESTQSFWHANHAEPGMKVYQSTKEKFAAGYIDFDRIVYCVAWARNYKPRDAARNH